MVIDFRQKEQEEANEDIFRSLKYLESSINKFQQFVMPNNSVLQIIIGKDEGIPYGYFECNGKNGTFDLSGSTKSVDGNKRLLYIQKGIK